MTSKRFTKINDGFVCDICGHTNPPADKTCRDHCRKCLCSKHVDVNPGDRAETCQGILKPVDFDVRGGSVYQIIFLCSSCGAQRKNKLAEDDNKEKIWEIMAGK